MKLIIYPEPLAADHRHTYAGNGGSDGLFLSVANCPVSFLFDNAAEAFEIASAILGGLHPEIQRWFNSQSPPRVPGSSHGGPS